MGSILGTIFAFLIVFGVLVFVHEFGHFFMAKLVGINVEVFSFGYGKRLFGLKRGGTDYRISLIPMGGYVKFSGEEALEGLKKNIDPKPGDFLTAKRWERFLVILMGPVMNIVLALVLVAFINMGGVAVPEHQNQVPVIGWAVPGSPAAKANLLPDDVILSINDQDTKTWNDVDMAVGMRPDKNIRIKVKRGEEILTIELLTDAVEFELGYAGFYGKILTQVYMVLPRSPAEKAGLKSGDVILAINNEPIYLHQFTEIIEKNPDNELDFLIDRKGENLTIKISPRKEGDVGKIGINPRAKTLIKQYGFFASFGESFRYNIRLVSAVVNFLKNLFIGEASTRQLGGPIDIANLSYAFFRMGFLAMLGWIAFISLQLGIINLVPVPVFDGGQIMVLGLEGIFRRDFNPRVKQVIMQIGFAIFIFLMVFIILNDVVKRLPNGWDSITPW